MPRGDDLRYLKESLPEDWKDIPILSYSQLMTLDRCSFLWYVKYGLKLKVNKANKYLDRGSFTHTLLHDLYMSIAAGMSAQEWSNTRLNPMVMDIVDSLNFEDQISSAATAMKLVERFCRTDVLGDHIPVGAEQHFFVLVTTNSGRKFILQGYVDLITIDSLGRVWVWDHKTGERLWSSLRVKMFIQLPIYQILLRADGMDVYGLIVNQLNSYPYKDMNAQPDDKLFKRDPIIWSPGQLQNVWNEFMGLAEEALDLIAGDTTIRRSIRDDCHNCDMLSPCHANLSGEPLNEAIVAYSNHNVAFRGMPAGTGVTLDLS